MVLLSLMRVQRLPPAFTSKEIRTTFINYFEKQHGHKFIRSSPILPLCDPGLAFVNAGMNQFKSIFLGTTKAPSPCATNYQKCVRVGGKHNDLTSVGQDGYHHTFFEMLGNWSFGDYFKEKACQMALDLLCGQFHIDQSRLYVTYFAGDQKHNLPADLECFEIWQKLGFPPNRILPFSMKENFWEMGLTGPCGPCTEIHIDLMPHGNTNGSRSHLVNTGHPELIELWNLVFMEYNRNLDGSINKLPSQFVDTGMGFERLTMVLQNKNSNYDTDIFMPILRKIEQVANCKPYTGSWSSDLDINYRILADHARMVCICLADGMLPDKNQKLRRILRRALTISQEKFWNENLFLNLVPTVVESLGTAYPELVTKELAIQELLKHEQEVYSVIRKDATKAFNKLRQDFPHFQDFQIDYECPGFVPGYYEFQKVKDKFVNRIIPGDFLYKLNDTYGLNEEHFRIFAEMENMTNNMEEYYEYLNKTRVKTKSIYKDSSRIRSLHEMTKNLPPTRNEYKYKYSFNKYTKQYDVLPVMAKVLAILSNNIVVGELMVKVNDMLESSNETISIVSDISNFYYESGGQESDTGSIILYDKEQQPIELKVINVICVNNCVVHICQLPSKKTDFILKIDNEILLKVDNNHRTANTCHHTAVHLLNAAIRNLYNKVTYQVSSSVNKDYCKLEVGIIGLKLTHNHVDELENMFGEQTVWQWLLSTLNLFKFNQHTYVECTPMNYLTILSNIILSAVDIQVQADCNMTDILQMNDVITVPGEIYPDTGLRVIAINSKERNLFSNELCCGTHALKTDELKRFCITNLKQTNRARYAFTAAAGEAAEKILNVKDLLENRINMLENAMNSTNKLKSILEELQKLRHNIIHMNVTLPFTFKGKIIERINTMLRSLKEIILIQNRNKVEFAMRNALMNTLASADQEIPFILHCIKDTTIIGNMPLQAATNLCTNFPILVIGISDNILNGRCCVPEDYQMVDFTAIKWLRQVADVLECQTVVAKSCDPNNICDLESKKIKHNSIFEKQLQIALDRANTYAKKYLIEKL